MTKASPSACIGKCGIGKFCAIFLGEETCSVGTEASMTGKGESVKALGGGQGSV